MREVFWLSSIRNMPGRSFTIEFTHKRAVKMLESNMEEHTDIAMQTLP